jgi:hypothetical protein
MVTRMSRRDFPLSAAEWLQTDLQPDLGKV